MTASFMRCVHSKKVVTIPNLLCHFIIAYESIYPCILFIKEYQMKHIVYSTVVRNKGTLEVSDTVLPNK